MTQPKFPEFVTPGPTTVEQTGPDSFAIHEDSGYRANVEYIHTPCGSEPIDYLSTRLVPDGAGWVCRKCSKSLTDPSDVAVLDRMLLSTKVRCTMLDMHELSKEIYVSNGDMGEVVTRHVMRQCVEADDYSEAFIIDAIKGELS